METRILSLDIATTTGWAFYNAREKKFIRGLIKTSPKNSEAKRLSYFRSELLKLFKKYKPTHIVMEDIYAGRNIKTLKLLAKFAGVAEECSITEIDVDPYIIHTTTVKSFFKAKTKEDLFEFVSELIDWKEAKFKKDNDMVDAIAQLMCYWDKVLKEKKYRIEKEYGYLYEVN
jgi:Holliday junction resolvasome RuvABC endonuclease subunit